MYEFCARIKTHPCAFFGEINQVLLLYQEVQELIKQVDKDGDGRVNKDEFKRLMCSK